MFTAVKINLEMAHVIANSKNPKERNIHGHSWKFEVTFEGENLDYDILLRFVFSQIYTSFEGKLWIKFDDYPDKLKKHMMKTFTNIRDCENFPDAEYILKTFQGMLHTPPIGNIAKLKLWEGTKYYVKIK